MVSNKETAECLKSIGIQDLDEGWVNAVWNSDFTESPDLPTGAEELFSNHRQVLSSLRDATEVCTPWARIDFATLPQGFWNVLCENGIVPRSLLAGLYYFIDGVDSLTSTALERELAITAGHLYILLLEIPGSGAYRVQQPMLFEKALNTFKLWPRSESNKRKRAETKKGGQQRPASRQGQGSKGQGAKSRRLNTGGAASQNASGERQGEEGSDDDDDEEEEVVALTTQEVDRIQRAILHATKEVVYMLRSVPLKSSDQIIDHVMMRLAEVSRTPTEQAWDDTFGNNISLDEVYSISHLAFLGMEALCSGSHGDPSQMLRMVFNHLLPNILMLIGENRSVAMATIPKHIQLMKDHAEAFASHMNNQLGEKALPCIRVLMQHMCVKVPDKVEYRTRVSHTIARLLAGVPPEAEASFVKWLYLYSKNAKISYRVFALEVVSALLERPERQTSGEAGTEQQQFLSHRFLLDIMISRCSDKAPTVRAKALSCFAQFTALAGQGAGQSIGSMLSAPTAKTGVTPIMVLTEAVQNKTSESGQDVAEDAGKAAMDCGKAAGDEGQQEMSIETAQEAEPEERPSEPKKGATPGNLMGGSPALFFGEENGEGFAGSSSLLSCLKQRVCDDKVGVRKAALQALENVFKLQCMTFDLQLLEILRERCHDTALSVRKQALDSLTSLLKENPRDERVQRVWLQGVLPVVSDRESSASEKCLQLLQELVLDGVCRPGATEARKLLAWSLLAQLMQPDLCSLRVYFQRVCRLWARQKLLTPSLVRGLSTHTEGANATAAWMFLSEVSHFCPHLDTALILQTWARLTSDPLDRSVPSAPAEGSLDSEILASLLSVMGSLAGQLTEEERRRVVMEISERLIKMLDSPNMIGAMVETLYKLCCVGVPETQTTNPALDEVCDKILQACDSHLSSVLLSEDGPRPDEAAEELLIGRIFLLGEIAQLCPYRMPRRVFTLVQSLLAGSTSTSISEGSELPSSQGLTQFSQPPLSQFRTGGAAPVSMALRAHAFVTLGKLCLHHEGLAKQCIAALARELEVAEDSAVRNNVALVMCDLCIRYPNLVDRYVPNLAACLKDKDKLVRKQCLTQLTRLVLEDYIKWRGPLFFRFISVIVDEVDTVREFGEYCLVELLLQRHPGMLLQQFVEGVFHFNNYRHHAVFNQFSQSDRERELFTLEGPDNTEKRMTIYRFMLSHMTDEHRFKLTAKLIQEVLGAFVDGVLPLNEETSALLKDTLHILCSKEIKLASLHAKQTNPEDIVEEMQMAEAVMAQAKSKIISQVVKKNVIENVVPVIIALKHMLEKEHSPLLGDLMLYLKELMKDYRNEVKDILSADRQLASEIEFDLRKFDEQQQAEAARREEAAKDPVSSEGNQPQGGSPGVAGGTPGAGKPATPGRVMTPILLSPKAVAGCSPRVVRRTPRTPAVSTAPTKERLLAAQAIVNSARKALASATGRTPQRVPASPGAPGTPASAQQPRPSSPKNGSPLPTEGGMPLIEERVRRVRLSSERTEGSKVRSPLVEVNEDNSSKDSIADLQRAISTPDKTIANITFHAPMDVSAIPPPSPIPSSLPIRVYGEQDSGSGTKSWTPRVMSNCEVRVKKENLILMFSPDEPAPKPRVWNITSPSASQKRASRQTVRPRQQQPEEMRGVAEQGTQEGGRQGTERRRSGRLAKGR
ncbi:condensin-2 complex subunit D3-L-like [Diadema antillarum]|uniref:condensin-2 complex subunit D3-L-like n=1 Tax=Diadema antillarum TaxID=105358 RepID=UPI003A8BE812